MAPSPQVSILPGWIQHGGSTITIKRLQCPHSVTADYVWGSAKEQPAYLDVKVALDRAFNSAASADTLDASTIHYGQLAKRIKGLCVPGMNGLELLSKAEDVILQMGTKSNGETIINSLDVDLILPKASMYGEEFRFNRSRIMVQNGGDEQQCLCEFRGLKFMGVIGVNKDERTGQQPIHAYLELAFQASNVYASQYDLQGRLNLLRATEQILNDVVQKSAYETLESLIQHATKAIHDYLSYWTFRNAHVTLRLEKPKAIPFADTAVVELKTKATLDR